MKPTEQQKEWLQDYLVSVLTYRETYEEVYDHILSALEHKPEREFFETIVNEVIEEEFGGSSALVEMETNCRNGVIADIYKEYWSYFYDFLALPKLILMIISAFILFYISRQSVIINLCMNLGYYIALPALLIIIRELKNRYTPGNKTLPYKNRVFRKIAFRPFFLILAFGVLRQLAITTLIVLFNFRNYKNHLYVFFNNSTSIIILILLTIHTLAYIKLLRQELKTNITID